MLSVSSFAFNVPERLEYDLAWVGINAGSAILSIDKQEDAFVITSRARSNKFISVFYKVDDKVWCIVDGSDGTFGYTKNYRVKLREGRHRRDKEVVFDQELKKAHYIDHRKGKTREYTFEGNVHDPLSGFFAMRKINLVVGESVKVRIFDSKRMWDVEVDVLRKEKVNVPAGVFDAIVVKPKLKSEGFFKRKGDIIIWLTDDERKVPVKMQTKAPVGHISADLTGGIF